ncbi:MAG: hypothetical protein LBG95_10075 [Treponema sp.]|jgi:hypothetical protein|nr:hypothetical protein [Treponema sp.]
MKKFLVTLLALIIIAALGLFFGWAQSGVPPDAYGVIRSKTHGIDTRLVKAGEFRWIWYKLIPTNVTTSVFRLVPAHYEFSANNTLPSGKTYAAFAGIDESFSWEIRAAFSFSLRPEAIVALVEDHAVVSQDDLDRYENDIAGQMETFILRRLNSGDEFSREIEDLLDKGDSPGLTREIQEQFPLIGNFSLMVKSAEFPDFALYKLAKGIYEEYVSLQKDYISGDLREKAKSRVESYHRFNELEQYGALLAKYPILLDYLALENKGK